MPKEWTRSALARTIDHSLLKATATERSIRELCAEAKKNGFASVCVNPIWVQLCSRELALSGVLVGTVIGFPLGASASESKACEARLAISQGAREIDMVVNIGAAKSGDWQAVEEDIRSVVRVSPGASVRAIIETCYLDVPEKIRACEAVILAGAQFIQTSTGFGTGGATVEDVVLLKKTLGNRLKIKASGGIRTYHDAIQLLEAGADRIGASSGIAIVSEMPE